MATGFIMVDTTASFSGTGQAGHLVQWRCVNPIDSSTQRGVHCLDSLQIGDSAIQRVLRAAADAHPS